MAKGIALQTILMLLVGILVVGIVVYLVYRYMVGPGLTTEGCRQAIVNWCTTCSASGWISNIKVSSDVNNCWNNNFFNPSVVITDCAVANTNNYCDQFGIT